MIDTVTTIMATASSQTPFWQDVSFVGAVVAAVIAGGFVALGLIVNGRRARLDRQRQIFAKAFAATQAYCEFPYIVRRRHPGDPGQERVRISTELSEVQKQLNESVALLKVEASRVGRTYQHLVAENRRVAGAAISTGWDAGSCSSDDGVHITDVDLSPIAPAEEQFLLACRDHLSLAPAWLVRSGRQARRILGALLASFTRGLQRVALRIRQRHARVLRWIGRQPS